MLIPYLKQVLNAFIPLFLYLEKTLFQLKNKVPPVGHKQIEVIQCFPIYPKSTIPIPNGISPFRNKMNGEVAL